MMTTHTTTPTTQPATIPPTLKEEPSPSVCAPSLDEVVNIGEESAVLVAENIIILVCVVVVGVTVAVVDITENVIM